MSEKPTFMERIKKLKLTNNIGLKIISLIIATVMWMFVVNITDPISTQTFRNVPVRLMNTSQITDNGKTYEIVDGTEVISSVTIKAPRTVIQELGSSVDNVIATADFSKLSVDQTTIPVDISFTKYSDKIESIKSSESSIEVVIENKKTIQLPILATTSGEIEDGYVLGNIKVAQNQVRVSGPESVINSIKSATVDVQVTGFTESISTQSDISLSDSEGNVISHKNISLNVDSVKVDVEILATKKVPVYFNVMGTPAEGYEMTGEVECDIATVVIAGTASKIESINKLVVPESALNTTGQSSDLKVLVNLNEYLPEGTRLGDPSFNGIASVVVYIEPITEREESLDVRNISIEGTPVGFEAELEDINYITFKLSGLSQNLEKVELGKLDCHVDFNDYVRENNIEEFKAGEYKLMLNMLLPTGVTLSEPVYITVKLTAVK